MAGASETAERHKPPSGNDSNVAECRVGRTLPASRPVVAGAISVPAGDPRRPHLADHHQSLAETPLPEQRDHEASIQHRPHRRPRIQAPGGQEVLDGRLRRARSALDDPCDHPGIGAAGVQRDGAIAQ